MFSENEKQIEYEKFAEFVAKFCEDSLKFSKPIKIVIIRNIFSIYSLVIPWVAGVPRRRELSAAVLVRRLAADEVPQEGADLRVF